MACITGCIPYNSAFRLGKHLEALSWAPAVWCGPTQFPQVTSVCSSFITRPQRSTRKDCFIALRTKAPTCVLRRCLLYPHLKSLVCKHIWRIRYCRERARGLVLKPVSPSLFINEGLYLCLACTKLQSSFSRGKSEEVWNSSKIVRALQSPEAASSSIYKDMFSEENDVAEYLSALVHHPGSSCETHCQAPHSKGLPQSEPREIPFSSGTALPHLPPE